MTLKHVADVERMMDYRQVRELLATVCRTVHTGLNKTAIYSKMHFAKLYISPLLLAVSQTW